MPGYCVAGTVGNIYIHRLQIDSVVYYDVYIKNMIIMPGYCVAGTVGNIIDRFSSIL